MIEVTHRTIETNGIRMHIAERGAGPLVVLCHGFPESWYSWRHQIRALAEAGFHVVAPDMRGYGQTDRPDAIEAYTLLHLVGDMVGLLNALGAEQAVIAGHDWGAPVAWEAARLRPDRLRAVIALSVPFLPWSHMRPTSAMPQTDAAVFYQLYFQKLGVAEAEMEQDLRSYLRSVLYGYSGDGPFGERGLPAEGQVGMIPREGGLRRLIDNALQPATLPGWITEADIDFYVAEFARTGLRGGLNWYRNIDRNWELLAAFAGLQVTVPALFLTGDRDVVLAFRGRRELVSNLSRFVPRLRETIMLPGCGHWTQQERAADVNAAMIDFIRRL